MASDELSAKLQKRTQIIDAEEEGVEPELPSLKVFNPYTEFKEFSRKEIQDFQKLFNKYDQGRDHFIDLTELKFMMEQLKAPQTHLSLKHMIQEVDEDQDGMINFREFLLIFRKAAAGELAEDSGLYEIYRQMAEIDVDKEGVKGAKNFFEAKIDNQTRSNKFEQEIKDEQEQKRLEEIEKQKRRQDFKAKASLFK